MNEKMLNNLAKKAIRETINNLYQSLIDTRVKKIIVWPWINLCFYVVIFFTMVISALSFILIYDSHFLQPKVIFLPLAISFLLIFIILILSFYFLKKEKDKLYQILKTKLQEVNLINYYNLYFLEHQLGITLSNLAYQWAIMPTNPYYLETKGLNDQIIIGTKNDLLFNLGTVSQTTVMVLDNLQPNYIPKPYNLNYYRTIFLTTKISNNLDQNWEIRRTNKYQKENQNFDNFFHYDPTNKWINAALVAIISDLMLKTKLIPSIKVVDQVLSVQLTTISLNSAIDNSNSFFNFEVSFNQKRTLVNIYQSIEYDLQNISKCLEWLILAKY